MNCQQMKKPDDIRAIVKNSGLTLAKISELSGLPKETIGSWVHRQRNPGYYNLLAVLNACGYDLKLVKLESDKAAA